MKVNANYTWIKCNECGYITKILPGQKFDNREDFAKLYECECQPKLKKRVRNAT